MLTIDYFINGNTVDNDALMRQWQLCQEAQDIASCSCVIGASRRCYDSIWRRYNRRHNTMIDLIFEWNKSTKIIEDQGDQLRHAVRVAQNLHEAGLGEFTAIVLEELPF